VNHVAQKSVKTELADLLASGIAELGLTLDQVQQDKLLAYVALLAKWNKVYNLTAVREPERMIGLHILDSLALVPYLLGLSEHHALRPAQRLPRTRYGAEPGSFTAAARGELVEPHKVSPLKLLDVGSGGGLPGICVAIGAPMLEVAMLDSLQKKTTFIRQAIGELGLKNASVVCERVENFRPQHQFEFVTSRAFAELADFVNAAAHLLAPNGKLLAMKGVFPHDEIANLPATHAVVEVIELHVPQVEGQRHLVVIESKTNA